MIRGTQDRTSAITLLRAQYAKSIQWELSYCANRQLLLGAKLEIQVIMISSSVMIACLYAGAVIHLLFLALKVQATTSVLPSALQSTTMILKRKSITNLTDRALTA